MQDTEILDRIGKLVDAEHALHNRGGDHPLTADEESHLHSVEIALDQLWDLLDQRRARRDAGKNPDGAHLRDATTVERYVQ